MKLKKKEKKVVEPKKSILVDMNPDIPEVTGVMCPNIALKNILNMIIAKVNA